ncbi:MAG TPA: hypothetical protein VFZ61_30680 [Polyangiales bacterium]
MSATLNRQLRALAATPGTGWLALAIGVSLAFLYSPGTFDVATWLDRRWLPSAEEFGLIEGYTQAHDNYPPLSFLMIGLVGPAAHSLGLTPFVVFKLVLFAFLTCTTLLTWFVTRRPLVALAMHLPLTVSAMLHGYTDVLYAPQLVLTCWLLQKQRLAAASAVFTLGALMKYQPLILAPVLVLHALAPSLSPISWRDLRRRASALLLPACTLCLTARLIFGEWTTDSLRAALRGHTWLSANALNAGWLVASALAPADPLSVQVKDGLLWKLPGLLCAGGLALSLVGYWRSRRDLPSALAFAGLGYLSYFMFNLGVHENHLCPAVILCTLAAAADPGRFAALAYWPVAAVLNHLLFYGFTGEGFPFRRDLAGLDLTVPFALLNLLVYCRCVWSLRTMVLAEPMPSAGPLRAGVA